ncbi:hypothetical protein [Streptomyces uncialis]|uniref:Uncharacterized protein n=1 Tax=Streptomyces uncialis TaxID=1048205 RepID=A0A1Q4UY40_9ACTN|nr:hypothetical protein [Streptomyces uncialis]OKH90466.1 hypothetical protein AB852_35455 [Streptomyces uncialis]
MTGEIMALFACADCKAEFTECPDCVCTIRIDPLTGLPPDVIRVDGRAVYNPDFDPEALHRSVKSPVCDACVKVRNTLIREGVSEPQLLKQGIFTLATDRHQTAHL